MQQYQVSELRFTGEPPKDSFVEINLTALIQHDQEIYSVKGFYAGENTYVVRFYPRFSGSYKIIVSGVIQSVQEVDVLPATDAYHGIVRADGLHLKYDDGKWFYPFGTTIYALIHQPQELITQTFETLKDSPFNKVRMCLFPKSYEYNQNDPDFYAFEKIGDKWDVHKPDFRYWNALERHLIELDKLGIQADLILFHPYDRWGFATLSIEEAKVYLDYVCRRLSAFPNVWWSLANEYDLMNGYQWEDWENFADFIGKNDPYHHLLSNHNIVKYWDFNNKDTTHISLQISDVDTVRTLTDQYKKPMLIDECRYEGNLPEPWGNISGFELVSRFWKVMLQGGYCTHGETYYNDKEIIWWSKGGQLVGESPKRIAFLKNIVEELGTPLECSPKYGYFESIEQLRQTPPEFLNASPIFRELIKRSDEDIARFAAGTAPYQAKSGESVIKYFGSQRPYKTSVSLPDDMTYTIEVIDTWEMTRFKFTENGSGNIEIDLPSKEGMAILYYPTNVKGE